MLDDARSGDNVIGLFEILQAHRQFSILPAGDHDNNYNTVWMYSDSYNIPLGIIVGISLIRQC